MMSFEWLDIPLAIEWLGESYIEGAVAISICSIYIYIYIHIFPMKYAHSLLNIYIIRSGRDR